MRASSYTKPLKWLLWEHLIPGLSKKKYMEH